MEDFPDQYHSEVQITMRIQTFFQNNSFIRNDIDKHFDNKTWRLSRCESIPFPTLEILDKAIPKESGHYWLGAEHQGQAVRGVRLGKDAKRQGISRYCKQNHQRDQSKLGEALCELKRAD